MSEGIWPYNYSYNTRSSFAELPGLVTDNAT